MKLIVRDLPQRFEQRMAEGSERTRARRFPFRRFHPMLLEEMGHMISRRKGDAIGILIIASLAREEFPWLYEIGLEAYRATKGRNIESAREALKRFRNAAELTADGPLSEMGFGDKESHMMTRELPMLIDRYLERIESFLPHPIEKRSRSTRTDETEGRR